LNHADLVRLLRDGVPSAGGRWADLGAGEGAFTLALADLLGPGALITAVDRDPNGLKRLAAEMRTRFPATQLGVVVADFTRPLALAELDGVVMANSLHFVRDKRPVLSELRSLLRPGGRLIVVEYDADRGNPWVPYPFSYRSWQKMAAEAGFERTQHLASIPSRFLGSIYSSVSESPASASVARD
jgi:ubiquinone/menaquinone biosynthesis C-methylase UbiE